MRSITNDELLSLTPKQAASWVFNTNPDYVNPFAKDSDKFNEFANEYHRLTVERL